MIDKRMAQDGGEPKRDTIDIVARAYDTGLQVGVTLAHADLLGQVHGEFCHLSRDQWLAARRSMALREAQQ